MLFPSKMSEVTLSPSIGVYFSSEFVPFLPNKSFSSGFLIPNIMNRGNLLKMKILQAWHMVRSQKVILCSTSQQPRGTSCKLKSNINWHLCRVLTLRGFSLVFTSHEVKDAVR